MSISKKKQKVLEHFKDYPAFMLASGYVDECPLCQMYIADSSPQKLMQE